MSDLQSKYQKLASEYAKLKAQLPVLKKAVLDEQGEKSELEDVLKEKDQAIRKYEQEIDSLVFRNQQLSTRISILQVELDELELKWKKNKKHPNSNPDFSPSGYSDYNTQVGVIGEELQSKIEENARLHNQVHRADEEHRQTVGELRDKLLQLEAETNRHQEVLQSAVQQSQSQIDKLQDEKARAEVRLQKNERDTKDSKEKSVKLESDMRYVQDNLKDEVERIQTIKDRKLPFNDSEVLQLNSLNVPSHHRQQQLQTRELVVQALGLIKELIQGLCNFYTYNEQRTKAYPVDIDTDMLSDINQKYCQHLHENALYLRPIEQTFKAFHDSLKEDILVTLETACGLEKFAEEWKTFVLYAEKLLPYQLKSLEEESSVSSCTETLASKNMDIHSVLKHFLCCLQKVQSYISIIASQSTVNCVHPKPSQSKMFDLLAGSIADFHTATQEMSKHYNAKVSLEHQLPTATQKLRVTDECIMSSLVSLVTCTSKLSAFIAGNLEFFKQSIQPKAKAFQNDRIHPITNIYRKKAAEYMELISRQCPESVPHMAAIQNRQTLINSTESRETLAQQVVNLQDKVSTLEQSKEHWTLELQLMQIKYEKEKHKGDDFERKVVSLEAKLSGSIADNLDNSLEQTSSVPFGINRTNSTSISVDNSILGVVENVTTGELDWDSREKVIRQHFTNRITEITKQLQIADTKALYFYAECRALHKQLQMKRKSHDNMQDELHSATQGLAQLKDDLKTTTKSYEGQLTMMSEHLAAMNDKLAAQKDEIDLLKYQLKKSEKGHK